MKKLLTWEAAMIILAMLVAVGGHIFGPYTYLVAVAALAIASIATSFSTAVPITAAIFIAFAATSTATACLLMPTIPVFLVTTAYAITSIFVVTSAANGFKTEGDKVDNQAIFFSLLAGALIIWVVIYYGPNLMNMLFGTPAEVVPTPTEMG